MDFGTNISSINVNSFSKISSAKKPITEKKSTQEQRKHCFCSTLAPILFVARIFGFFPIVWGHVRGQCTYKASYIWLGYSGLICLAYDVQLFTATDLLHFDKDKPLPELLTDINDIMYLSFVAALTVLNIIRFPRFVKTLNKLYPTIRDAGLGCPSSFAMLKRISYGYLFLFFAYLVMEYSILVWLNYSENYQTNFDYKIFLHTGVQSVPFVFYLLFFLSCSLFISILGCFEKVIISTLKFTPVHPLSDIDETNNKKDFVGLIKYEICQQAHNNSVKMTHLTQSELIEYLRSLHEDISLIMYDVNSCMNPQLLFHTVVELTVLIIHWYEVIIYTSYTFSTPFASTINILNWIFVIAHSVGLFLFLKSAQELKNMIQGLTNFLLEYSTRISNPEEHQQIRIFIEKIQEHRPITANGVFSIDLGIAGPISANILTYVLVALQFDIPKN